MRDWRVCEVDGGGKVSQTCEIIKEGGRKGVDIVSLEVFVGIIGERENGVKLEWRYEREERPVNKTGSREVR